MSPTMSSNSINDRASSNAGQQTTSMHERTQQQAKQMANDLDAPNAQSVRVEEIIPTNTTTIIGSAKEAATTLSFIDPSMETLTAIFAERKALSFHPDSSKWLDDELCASMADVYEQLATELRDSKRQRINHAREHHDVRGPNLDELSARTVEHLLRQAKGKSVKHLTSLKQKRKRGDIDDFMEVQLPIGKFQLKTISDEASRTLFGFRFMYMPSAGLHSKTGLILSSVVVKTQQQSIRCLSMFQKHPKDSEVVNSIVEGDLNRVQQLLSEGKLFPWDRDENGHSLFLVCFPVTRLSQGSQV